MGSPRAETIPVDRDACRQCGERLPDGHPWQQRFCAGCAMSRRRYRAAQPHPTTVTGCVVVDQPRLDCRYRADCLETLLQDTTTCRHLEKCKCRLKCADCVRYTPQTRDEIRSDMWGMADLVSIICADVQRGRKGDRRPTRQHVAELRDRRLAAGLCAYCGREEHVEERMGCASCLAEANQNAKARKRLRG